ncbi:hypothetical protein [Sphingomonas sp. PAMC 26621]|uniref:hypothetical protein n=1 Tax=Sphingomonas sp. PAMC 26621 TaxID=1112213 RepID=UPI00028940D7|nr:hypothetical protein [Sphingomonas sp. PAMC 26621]
MGISTASSLSIGVSAPFALTKPYSVSERNEEAAAKSKQIVADFQKEAKKSPIDRMIERILKSHKLTKEQFDALPREQKEAISKEIQDAIEQASKRKGGTSAPGDKANVLV